MQEAVSDCKHGIFNFIFSCKQNVAVLGPFYLFIYPGRKSFDPNKMGANN